MARSIDCVYSVDDEVIYIEIVRSKTKRSLCGVENLSPTVKSAVKIKGEPFSSILSFSLFLLFFPLFLPVRLSDNKLDRIMSSRPSYFGSRLSRHSSLYTGQDISAKASFNSFFSDKLF